MRHIMTKFGGLFAAACFSPAVESGASYVSDATVRQADCGLAAQNSGQIKGTSVPFQPQIGVGEHARPVALAPEGEHAGGQTTIDHDLGGQAGKTYAKDLKAASAPFAPPSATMAPEGHHAGDLAVRDTRVGQTVQTAAETDHELDDATTMKTGG